MSIPFDPFSDHMPDTIEECHALITALRSEVRRLLAFVDTVNQLEARVAELEKQLRRSNRAMFGKKSAKVAASSLTGTAKEIYEQSQNDLGQELNNPTESEAPKKNGGGGRTATRIGAPRTIEHEITDPLALCCPDCGAERQKIGFEVSHQLDVLDTVFELLKQVQFKYACTKCQSQIIKAPKPEQPIAKGYAGPGLIAHIGRAKFDWHMPLYRQERIARAQGVQLSRSSMCRILKEGAAILEILVRRMHKLLLESRLVLSDGTTMPVIKRGLGKVHNGCTWIYRNEHYVLYDFTETKESIHPEKFLKGFEGVLLTDGASTYNGVIKAGARKAGCSSHAFRYFEDARKEDPERADVALAFYKSLFDIERFAVEHDFSEAELQDLRARQSKPKLVQLKVWLDNQDVIPKTAMGEAITYCRNQWDALAFFADSGFVPMHNNQSENGLRPAVLGRRNWLFAGSVEGGNTAAIWMSIIQTCRHHSIDPFAYLKEVFTLLPSCSTSQIDQFLPHIWKAAQENKVISSSK